MHASPLLSAHRVITYLYLKEALEGTPFIIWELTYFPGSVLLKWQDPMSGAHAQPLGLVPSSCAALAKPVPRCFVSKMGVLTCVLVSELEHTKGWNSA